ncbi:MAG TPA: chemotaxis protein CheW [Gemmatimonadales bacterium]|nr:chemotaxis protein CheW [Gemmatimonadales bacterium]
MTPFRRTQARDPVDWAELRRRLDEVQARASMAASPEQVRERLRERARALAQPVATDAVADAVDHITFRLGSEECGLESRFVLEIVGRARLTPLPRVAPPAVGVTGWRGEVLTVMDLGMVLHGADNAPTGVGEMPQVLVIGDGRRTVGVLVTEVLDLQHVHLGALQPAGGQGERPCLRGITPDAISILDAAALIRQLTEGAPL